MCFFQTASKIPKGERMPKLTVLVDLDPIVRVNHVRALPWTCSLEEGTGTEASLWLGGALLNGEGMAVCSHQILSIGFAFL